MSIHASPIPSLQMLKFGGSLITDKFLPSTPRMDVLVRLAQEVAAVWKPHQPSHLIVGNGAGSFGHITAKKHATRQGVITTQQWRGFAEVWREAAKLNSLVTDAFHEAGLPAIAIHPSSVVTAENGLVKNWDVAPLRAALDAGLLPVIHGDVIFDTQRGGTILSTEDLFDYLAKTLLPTRILLVGIEQGVWEDFPACTRLIPEITPTNFPIYKHALGGSNAIDVTGGMSSKVQQGLALVEQIPDLEVLIFSGEIAGSVTRGLRGDRLGTRLKAGNTPQQQVI